MQLHNHGEHIGNVIYEASLNIDVGNVEVVNVSITSLYCHDECFNCSGATKIFSPFTQMYLTFNLSPAIKYCAIGSG
jgi:hypothetical protein